MDNLVSPIITHDLLVALRNTYALDWNGIHGVSHWQRVRDNGLRVGAATGADPVIVELFAFIHDIKRLNDGSDPQHGRRAAEWARSEGRELIDLGDGAFEQLAYACEHHTHVKTHRNITICTCWDADRLDLDRVYITPDPRRLCTAAARDPTLLKWAIRRSQEGRRARSQR
jgi:uncharacterized protein